MGVASMSTQGEKQAAQDRLSPTGQLKEHRFKFPWGVLSLEQVVSSSRALAYLRWLFRESRPDFLLRLLDELPYRIKGIHFQGSTTHYRRYHKRQRRSKWV